MKTIIAIVALTALIATPAFSQNRNANTRARAQALTTAPQQQWQTQRHSTNPSHDVYVNGQYVGSDPDPMIRYNLQREVDTTE